MVSVCRRWRSVALTSPDVVTKVATRIGGGGAHVSLRPVGVLKWLRTYSASRLRSLFVDMAPHHAGRAAAAAVPPAIMAAAQALAAACAAQGRLEQLQLLFKPARPPQWPELDTRAWLPGLPRLRALRLVTDGPLIVPAATLATLTALVELELQGRALLLTPAPPTTAALPASLTSLTLGGLSVPPGPEQVGRKRPAGKRTC